MPLNPYIPEPTQGETSARVPLSLDSPPPLSPAEPSQHTRLTEPFPWFQRGNCCTLSMPPQGELLYPLHAVTGGTTVPFSRMVLVACCITVEEGDTALKVGGGAQVDSRLKKRHQINFVYTLCAHRVTTLASTSEEHRHWYIYFSHTKKKFGVRLTDRAPPDP